jgi:phosphoribosyl 1,2-cyclic phosphodiesterase
MKVKFYGTRGSVPVCDPEFQEFGGNTTCIEISYQKGDKRHALILDAGTGIRNLGKDLKSNNHQSSEDLYIAFTHFHWDHIQGFPFFQPAFDLDQRIHIVAMGRDRGLSNLREIFETQMQERYFPVQLDNMGAHFDFVMPEKRTRVFNGTTITARKHQHPGGAYSYRFERNGKKIVICTDIEHGEGIDALTVQFAKNADILIHDAQYTEEELKTRRGWGHSSFKQAVEVAMRANAKTLIITHHDPDHDDAFLLKMEKKCQEVFPQTFLAREKMELEV